MMMLNSFLIGRTCESRASGGIRCFQLFVARLRGQVEQPTDSDNNEQKSPTKIIPRSRALFRSTEISVDVEDQRVFLGKI
jgi:hypothetical protein